MSRIELETWSPGTLRWEALEVFLRYVDEKIWCQTSWLIMTIELSGEQFGLKPYVGSQNRTSAQHVFDHKYDFRPKLQSSQFNYYLSAFVLKHPFGSISSKIRHTMAFFAFRFPAISLVTSNKPWNLTGCFVWVFFSRWLWEKVPYN